MAKVKTTGGKVILKNGKVSCECCAPVETCCMYPRSGYPDSFSFEDLPEKLNVDFPEGSGEWTLDVTAGIYTPSGTYTLGDLGYGYAESGDWVLWYPDPLEETYPNRDISPCLITGDGNFEPGDDAVEDQFEPTYTIGWTFLDAQSVEVERNSLCGWSYGPFPFPENPSDGDVFIEEASLFYFSRPQDPVPGVVYDMWLIEVTVAEAYDLGWDYPVSWNITSSGDFKKTPHQESPAGDYETTSGSLFTDVTVS
jgi:hypothetical protein